ncbi:Type 4 prepilin-like proteins leader peptide-processing enzyme [Koleobacter methoxysyntrophicus]|uniref:Type 4 prepilin-like proteins leader peptide-processing enzyme n=1 Tax=Koleobacter methoxysyntrophicus TaxID=2751313 RepID=A0A8A0RP90_9FIRM|nr:A24 family peptidase [Koleobacter methoxysyntrophicus]QSQ09390.1 Type 4 prepilin-like proteins leader peptide-processing enzyme [Koleobacter methoxysyntrophicus]
MTLILLFVLGTVIGSFINVCIYRIPRNKSVVSMPSFCPECGKRLKPYELIPIISYIIQGGKCRGCGKTISVRYPLVELSCGALPFLLLLKFPPGANFFIITALLYLMVVVTFIDMEFMIIPDSLILVGLLLGGLYTIFVWRSPIQPLLGMVTGSGLLFSIAILWKGGMGEGDVKYMGVLGIYLGFKLTILSLFLSFLLGAVIGIVLILSGKKGRRDMIPFGPFLSAAAFISILWGEGISNWYLDFLVM